MKKVTILALDGGLASTITGPLDVFQSAGVLWNIIRGEEPQPQFEVELASVDGQAVICAGGMPIQPSKSINEVTDSDFIIVPSAGGDLAAIVANNKPAISWLKQKYEAGVTIVSICTGAVLLAEAGLLTGKTATTHWGMASAFRRYFPQVKLRPERLVVDEGSVITGGGANSAQDLSLYLIEKSCGREISLQCSKALLIENGKQSQAEFSSFEFQKDHKDRNILDAQEWIEENFTKDLAIEKLAARQNMSPRNFERRFKKATGDSPLVYLQRIRISAAKQSLEDEHINIERLSASVGYEDVNFFRKLFKRHTGVTPNAYRQKFGVGARR